MTPSFRTRAGRARGVRARASRPPDGRARTTGIVVEALPIGAAVAAYGLSYGVLAVAAGLPPWLATATSLVVLAGGSQFAFIGVLAAGGGPLAGAVAGLMVNARYVAFGFAIAAHLPGGTRLRRLLDGYLVVDESVALALGRGERDRTRRFRLAGWTVVVAWVGASALGAYGGALIGDPGTFGLDAAFPAGFLALLAPWLRTRQGRIAAVTGAVLALGLAPIAPPGVPIIAAALGALVALAVPPAPGEVDGVGTTDAGHPSVGELAAGTGRDPEAAGGDAVDDRAPGTADGRDRSAADGGGSGTVDGRDRNPADGGGSGTVDGEGGPR